jgi:response regulator NasT
MIVQRPFQHSQFENQWLVKMAMNCIPPQKDPEPSEKYTVLIAEDDRTMAELLSTNLARLGHRVVGVASNGLEAIQLAIETRPDVVIMDIFMPVLNGLDAASEIITTQRIPIVLSTGYTDSKCLNRAVDLNVMSYLVKPFSPSQLKVALHLAIAQHRARQSISPGLLPERP